MYTSFTDNKQFHINTQFPKHELLTYLLGIMQGVSPYQIHVNEILFVNHVARIYNHLRFENQEFPVLQQFLVNRPLLFHQALRACDHPLST